MSTVHIGGECILCLLYAQMQRFTAFIEIFIESTDILATFHLSQIFIVGDIFPFLKMSKTAYFQVHNIVELANWLFISLSV